MKKTILITGIILALILIGGTILYFATRTSNPIFDRCGNDICEYREEVTCPSDCTTDFICGDGFCDLGEKCCSDCHSPECITPPQEYCGDEICQISETPSSCPTDCGFPLPICGDNKCEMFHYPNGDVIDEFLVCPQDCGIICGDGECVIDPYDERINCPQDCHVQIVCGNGICQEGETILSCPTDCKQEIDNEELIYQLNQKQRPLVGGLQIEMKRSNGIAYCSLGAIINYKGKNYILTASHCVATSPTSGVPSQSDIGLPVKQGGEIIGSVYKTADFTGGVDASLISINNGISSEQKDYLGNSINGFGTATKGLKVYKVGQRTGLTYGTISDSIIGFTGTDGSKWKAFEINGDNGNFCESGDSGSAIITVSSPHKIVGIISSGGGSGNPCNSNMPEDIKSRLGL